MDVDLDDEDHNDKNKSKSTRFYNELRVADQLNNANMDTWLLAVMRDILGKAKFADAAETMWLVASTTAPLTVEETERFADPLYMPKREDGTEMKIKIAGMECAISDCPYKIRFYGLDSALVNVISKNLPRNLKDEINDRDSRAIMTGDKPFGGRQIIHRIMRSFKSGSHLSTVFNVYDIFAIPWQGDKAWEIRQFKRWFFTCKDRVPKNVYGQAHLQEIWEEAWAKQMKMTKDEVLMQDVAVYRRHETLPRGTGEQDVEGHYVRSFEWLVGRVDARLALFEEEKAHTDRTQLVGRLIGKKPKNHQYAWQWNDTYNALAAVGDDKGKGKGKSKWKKWKKTKGKGKGKGDGKGKGNGKGKGPKGKGKGKGKKGKPWGNDSVTGDGSKQNIDYARCKKACFFFVNHKHYGGKPCRFSKEECGGKHDDGLNQAEREYVVKHCAPKAGNAWRRSTSAPAVGDGKPEKAAAKAAAKAKAKGVATPAVKTEEVPDLRPRYRDNNYVKNMDGKLVCHAHLNGKCTAGADCKFAHVTKDVHTKAVEAAKKDYVQFGKTYNKPKFKR